MHHPKLPAFNSAAKSQTLIKETLIGNGVGAKIKALPGNGCIIGPGISLTKEQVLKFKCKLRKLRNPNVANPLSHRVDSLLSPPVLSSHEPTVKTTRPNYMTASNGHLKLKMSIASD